MEYDVLHINGSEILASRVQQWNQEISIGLSIQEIIDEVNFTWYVRALRKGGWDALEEKSTMPLHCTVTADD